LARLSGLGVGRGIEGFCVDFSTLVEAVSRSRPREVLNARPREALT
jgi:hypothetical protein